MRRFLQWIGPGPKTVPDQTITGYPPGTFLIVSSETIERFTYYGMRTILAIVLVSFLPLEELMTQNEAQGVFHTFAAWNYFFPFLGAVLADTLLGKYRTILYLSLLYSIGCFVLALDQSRTSIYIGLFLIALGSGGIKPNVATCLGDQFGETNKDKLNRAIAWFYQGVNFGGLLSTFGTPIMLSWYGPRVAFGIPAVCMLIATWLFWLGRKNYAHVPPKGKQFLKDLKQELKPLFKFGGLYAVMAVYFSLYDQSGAEWVLQATKMDLNFLGIDLLAAQVQVLNPILIVLFAGTIEKRIFPLLAKIHPSELVRTVSGLFLTVVSFGLVAWIESRIEAGEIVNVGWQLLAYVILSVGEVLAYLSVLQLSYRKAKPTMKSFVMSVFLLMVFVGNLFTAGVNFFIQNEPPTFVPDKSGAYVLSLTTSDGALSSTAQVEVQALDEGAYAQHQAEMKAAQKKAQLEKKGLSVTAAALRRAVRPGTEVGLIGDFDQGDLSGEIFYKWSLAEKPADALIVGADRKLARATLHAEGIYKFAFKVNVGAAEKIAQVAVAVTKENLSPIADAGGKMMVAAGQPVDLDGNGSSDPNGDELAYWWRAVSVPDGSAIPRIENPTIVGPGSWLKGSSFYLFFTLLMLGVTILFIPYAIKVDLGPDYVQGAEREEKAA